LLTAASLMRFSSSGVMRTWIVIRSLAAMAATYDAKVYNPESVHRVL
jgi:hypothetical protein